MTQDEQIRLSNFRSMATMNQGQALEYHELLQKAIQEAVKEVTPEPAQFVEAPKRHGRKKK
jgi:hypothetical protein